MQHNHQKHREIKQLWFIANYYLNLSKECLNKIPKDEFKKRKGDKDKECENNQKFEINKEWMIASAHLASAALRLRTIEGVIGDDISVRGKLYRKIKKDENKLKKNLSKIIHYLFRNIPAHPEKWHKMEMGVIENLNLAEIYKYLDAVREAIEKDIIPLIT